MRTRVTPDRNSSMIQSRCSGLILSSPEICVPHMRETECPASLISLASWKAFFLVLRKITDCPTFIAAYKLQRCLNLSLSSQHDRYIWDTVVTVRSDFLTFMVSARGTCVKAKSMTSSGYVALKKRTCKPSGNMRWIWVICGPIWLLLSNIKSASSKTKTLTQAMSRTRFLQRAKVLPGVPMSTWHSAFLSTFSIDGTTSKVRTLMYWPSCATTCSVCLASSRVGLSTSACGRGTFMSIELSKAKANVAVFPVPFCACAIMFALLGGQMCGNAAAWILDGRTKPSSKTPWTSSCRRPRSSKLASMSSGPLSTPLPSAGVTNSTTASCSPTSAETAFLGAAEGAPAMKRRNSSSSAGSRSSYPGCAGTRSSNPGGAGK
mmetsp:Transcript_39015/g.107448  ORF Transcript_39015/g.107448 Transcript_39015/m.107448 type:complete len:377 (+) Transcript_39015:380-1510(+)